MSQERVTDLYSHVCNGVLKKNTQALGMSQVEVRVDSTIHKAHTFTNSLASDCETIAVDNIRMME